MSKCWWCSDHNSTLGCPIKLQKEGDVIHIKEVGYFCHPRCIKAFAINRQYTDGLYQAAPRLTDLTYGKQILPAPPPQMLMDYGGDMSRIKWRDMLKTQGTYQVVGITCDKCWLVYNQWSVGVGKSISAWD